jgi:histidinol dehydrogenase
MRIVKVKELDESFFDPIPVREEVKTKVERIVADVRRNGDDAVKRYTEKFDGVSIKDLRADFAGEAHIDMGAVKSSIEKVKKFSEKQLDQLKNFEYEITAGVFTGQRVMAIERVGIYVPGGRYPLVSTLIMCAVPAIVAGVKEIVICSPPSYNGSVHPAILIIAEHLGIDEVYRVGGAQAIAAMAYGTETIKRVDKIVGPGNLYVNQAKKEVFGVVGIDLIAGPTEILIIADETAEAGVIAADLLAQAEHDVDALSILITNSQELAEKVEREVEAQGEKLSTREVAMASIKKRGIILLVDSLEDGVEVANRRAPEHLELHMKDPERYVDRVRNCGTLFIGERSAVAIGDYSAGLNHTLPTNLGARYTGGLGVKDFLKLQTTLRIRENGISEIGTIAKELARMEGLDGHVRSIERRENR